MPCCDPFQQTPRKSQLHTTIRQVKHSELSRKAYICDQVNSRDLLHHLPTHSQKCPVEEALLPILEYQLERSLSRGCLLFSNGLRDLLHVETNDSIVLVNLSGIILQAPYNMASLIFVSMFDKLYHRVSSRPIESRGLRRTHRGDSGRKTTPMNVRIANTICRAIGKRNWASLLL